MGIFDIFNVQSIPINEDGAPSLKRLFRQKDERPGGIIGSFIDNVIRDTVNAPAAGSVVYCDLLNVEHSGIYVGNGKIVHLDGSGVICKVSASIFLDRLDGLNTAMSIYTVCDDEDPVGDSQVAERAKSMIGKKRDYNFILDNCHQFTAGCLTGDFNNGYNFLGLVKGLAEKELGGNTWRVWKT